MKVFISWSGDRSRAMANALKDYLPLVIQAVEPWFSPDDIDKGSRWLGDLTDQLQKQSVAIVCITPESVNSAWLLFEAGALSKALDASWVCPLLLDIEPTDIKGPLAQFQATKANKEDIRKLLATLNRRSDTPLSDIQIDRLHDALWPDFQKRISEIAKAATATVSTHRTQTDMLAEVLERVRGLERRLLESSPPAAEAPDELVRWVRSKAFNAVSRPRPKPQPGSLVSQIENFHRLESEATAEVRTLEHELAKLAPGPSMQRVAMDISLEKAQNRLSQYRTEISRLNTKLKRSTHP